MWIEVFLENFTRDDKTLLLTLFSIWVYPGDNSLILLLRKFRGPMFSFRWQENIEIRSNDKLFKLIPNSVFVLGNFGENLFPVFLQLRKKTEMETFERVSERLNNCRHEEYTAGVDVLTRIRYENVCTKE